MGQQRNFNTARSERVVAAAAAARAESGSRYWDLPRPQLFFCVGRPWVAARSYAPGAGAETEQPCGREEHIGGRQVGQRWTGNLVLNRNVNSGQNQARVIDDCHTIDQNGSAYDPPGREK
jgi:hypothetical protein